MLDDFCHTTCGLMADTQMISNIINQWDLSKEIEKQKEQAEKKPVTGKIIVSTEPKSQRYIPAKYLVSKIIRNGPCTIVFWKDGEKTIVRRSEGTDDDPYAAFCAALAKKAYGSNTRVKKILFEKTMEQKERKQKNERDAADPEC